MQLFTFLSFLFRPVHEAERGGSKLRLDPPAAEPRRRFNARQKCGCGVGRCACHAQRMLQTLRITKWYEWFEITRTRSKVRTRSKILPFGTALCNGMGNPSGQQGCGAGASPQGRGKTFGGGLLGDPQGADCLGSYWLCLKTLPWRLGRCIPGWGRMLQRGRSHRPRTCGRRCPLPCVCTPRSRAQDDGCVPR